MISQLLLYFCLLPAVCSLNIGLFSSPFNSQQIKNAVQLSNLFVNQHDVTLIRPTRTCKSSLLEPSEKVHQIYLNVSGLACIRDFKPYSFGKFQKFSDFSDFLAENSIFRETSLQLCKEILHDDNLIKEISKRKLDLAILSDVDYCLLGIIKRAGIAKWALAEPGVPSRNILIENGIAPASEDFVEKVQQLFIGTYNYLSEKWFLHSTLTELFHQHYGEEFETIATLRQQITTVMSGAQPILHNDFLYNNRIHFVNSSPKQKLETKAETVDVIVALDDNRTLSKAVRDALFDLFRNKKTTKFVWLTKAKHDIPGNVRLVASKTSFANAKLLISDGDYADMLEALRYGVPTLILGGSHSLDKSTRAFEKLEISIVADTDLIAHFDTILSAKSSTNVQRVTRLISKQPNDVDLLLEKAVRSQNLNQPSALCTLSIDVAIILFIPLYITFSFMSKLLGLYYWSCCEMAYKEKVKND